MVLKPRWLRIFEDLLEQARQEAQIQKPCTLSAEKQPAQVTEGVAT